MAVAIACGLSGNLLATPQCLSQSGTVLGSVSSTLDGRAIVGAIATLGNVEAKTDSAGRFRIFAEPGSYGLVVRAVGFLPKRIVLTLDRDTSVTILLEPSLATLDTMRVIGTDVTVKGLIIDSGTRVPLLRSQVALVPGGPTVGARTGHFSIRVPAGAPATLSVEALEYLPEELTINVAHDTSIVVALRVDSLALQRIQAQVIRLRERSQAMPYRIDALGREALRASGQSMVGHLILRRLPPRSVSTRWPYFHGTCVFLDDKKTSFDVLLTTAAEVVERVEIFGHDAKMIRVYSRAYVVDLQRQETIPRVVFMGNGLHQVCE